MGFLGNLCRARCAQDKRFIPERFRRTRMLRRHNFDEPEGILSPSVCDPAGASAA
jgi:hypothetical protein